MKDWRQILEGKENDVCAANILSRQEIKKKTIKGGSLCASRIILMQWMAHLRFPE